MTSDVAAGIRNRFERAAAAYKHKDESIEKGREFVEAYIEHTHYVEKLHQDATGKSTHAGQGKASKHTSEQGADADRHRH